MHLVGDLSTQGHSIGGISLLKRCSRCGTWSLIMETRGCLPTLPLSEGLERGKGRGILG